MKVTEQDVQHVAALASLELTRAERQRYVKDLNSILEYVELLNELDTDGLQPFSPASMVNGGALREDKLRPCLVRDAALMNAPQTDGIFFQVPKVVEKPGEAKK